MINVKANKVKHLLHRICTIVEESGLALVAWFRLNWFPDPPPSLLSGTRWIKWYMYIQEGSRPTKSSHLIFFIFLILLMFKYIYSHLYCVHMCIYKCLVFCKYFFFSLYFGICVLYTSSYLILTRDLKGLHHHLWNDNSISTEYRKQRLKLCLLLPEFWTLCSKCCNVCISSADSGKDLASGSASPMAMYCSLL